MMNKFSYCLIDQFIGAEFFKKYILPKSWFHLLKEDFLNEENIKNKILNIRYKEELPFNKSDLKRGLYECIAQIASSKMSLAQKKQMVSSIKSCFGFENDQEMIDLYKSHVHDESSQEKFFFESKVLIRVMKKLGMSKKYLLEDLLTKRDPERVLVSYSKK